MKQPHPYLTKELDMRPMNPTAAPTTAVFRQPNMSVKTLTMGQQKKIMPMDSEPTHAGKEGEHYVANRTHAIPFRKGVICFEEGH